MSADEIATEYDLILADVYAVLAYSLDHRTEVDESIRNGEAFAVALCRRLLFSRSKNCLVGLPYLTVTNCMQNNSSNGRNRYEDVVRRVVASAKDRYLTHMAKRQSKK